MLSKLQKDILFWIFCILTVFLGLSEVHLIYKLSVNEITWGKSIAFLLNSGLLAGSGTIFKKLLAQNFVDKEVLPMRRLHSLISMRRSIVDAAKRNGLDEETVRRDLVTNTLRFAELTLTGWIPGTHFELCVFIDADQPVMFSYFDSKHDESARSMKERSRNPYFHIEKSYEVSKMLQSPSSEPRIIENTADEKKSYKFVTEQQQRQLKSTAIFAIDINFPSALVLSSNAPNAILETNDELLSFLRFVVEQIRFDLSENNFLENFRENCSGYFSSELPIAFGGEAKFEGVKV